MVRSSPFALLQVPLGDTTPVSTLQFQEIFPSPSMPQFPQQPNSAMGWEHQKALWTLPAATDKAPEPNISGGHLLTPLPSKHQPAPLCPPQHPTAQGQIPTATTLGTKPHGQDPLTPLNKSHHHHSPQKPVIPKTWECCNKDGGARNILHQRSTAWIPAQLQHRALHRPQSPNSSGGGNRMAPRPWETSAEEELEPDGKVSATEWDENEWVSEGH